MGPTVDHLHILVHWFLPLQPHLVVELLNERLDSAVQLVLTQRRLLPQLARTRRGIRRLRVVVRSVPERLRFQDDLRRRRVIGGGVELTAVILPRFGLPQVPRERHVAAVRYRLPRGFERLLPLRLRHPQRPPPWNDGHRLIANY